ncbi:ribonuclease P protein subunit p30 [Aplysia californica]|uniref:Ribonuclease P protein subunit p30 n=1 Tax=Aplysia californica TaxID=6500 RepID=A0ABM0K025_APLCA|nr:ribonuclease P protein subunit p30 [Aplysia californica]
MAPPMYADLKLDWKAMPDNLLELVETALSLGYERIAFNNHVEELKGGKGKRQREKNEILPAAEILLNAETLKGLQVRGHRFEQLSRVTAVLRDAANTHRISSPEVQAYDLIAVQPTDDRTFQLACSSLDVDLISLDLSEHLGFVPKRPLVRLAAERGIHFELSYRPALSEGPMRRYVLSQALTLVTALSGRNIIISSGARETLELRSPCDVVNLAKLFSLSSIQAKDAVSRNCRAVLKHAESRRTCKSVLSVVKMTSLPAWEQHLHQQLDRQGREGREKRDSSPSTECETDQETPPPQKKLKV